jgi:uncharacterized membrane protein YhaH (DUF805 family)
MKKLNEASLLFIFTILEVLFNWVALNTQAIASSSGDLAACGGCGTVVLFIIAIFVINIMILVWVAKDAKARGMGSPIGWLILVVLTGLIGLIVYIFARPQGTVSECPYCHNKRLSTMVTCPHCGHSNTQERHYEPAQPVPPSSAAKFCSDCGSKIDEGHAFCQECGKPVS